MQAKVEEIRQYLAVAESEVQRIFEDRDLSDEGKAKRIAAVRANSANLAHGEAELWLGGLSRQSRRAKKAYDALFAEHRSDIDTQRESLAMSKISILAEHGEWDEIKAVMQEAIDTGDAAELKALATVAPMVRNRFRGDHRYGLDAGTMGHEVKRALAELEPAELRAAREAHEQAEVALAEARTDLDTLRFEYADLKGLPVPWLSELVYGKPEVVQEIGADGEVLAFTMTGGRGAFGHL